MKTTPLGKLFFTTTALCAFVTSPALAANFTITNGQTVNTTQSIGPGAGETGTVQAGGTISATGNDNSAITSSSANGTIINNGTISTTGQDAYGAYMLYSANNTFTNSGSITTSGDYAMGIVSTSVSSTLINNGIITTSGIAAFGADINSAANNTLTNNASITTTGLFASGINVATAANSILANNGSITTSGNNSSGVVVGFSNDSALTNNGSITTSGDNAHGSYVTNSDRVNLTNSGSIATSGSNSDGMYLQDSAGSTAINSGSITTDGNSGAGLHASSNNNTLTNNGTITTTGGLGFGLYQSSGSGNTLVNNGNIATSNYNAYGIYVFSGNNTAINNGTITTTSSEGLGMFSNAAGNSLTNNGSIITSGLAGYGMHENSGGTMINNGIISTTGQDAEGMYSTGENTTVTNSGAITVSGNNAIAILSNGDNANITNSGTINMLNNTSFAIRTTGLNSTATNNGTIHMGGTSDVALIAVGADSTLVNNGIITANGNDAYAMSGQTGANQTFINNGRIVVDTGSAVSASGDNLTMINAGYMRSSGPYTVELGGADNTIILKANSTVDGVVDFYGSGTRTLTYDVGDTGRAGSITRITGALTGTPTESITNTPSGMRAVQSGNTVAVVTPDQFGGNSQIISQTVSDAGNVLNNRQQLALLGDTTEANDGAQYAASSASANDASSPNDWAVRDRRVAWVEGFGSYQERGKTRDTSSSEAVSGGVLTGIDLPQTSEGVRAGFYAGGFAGALDVGNFKHVDSEGGMAGGYVGKSYGGYYISGGLGLGFSNNEADRFTGIDTATSDYTSYFVSPSLTVMRPMVRSGVTFVPSATIRYTAQYDEGYTEAGAVVNQRVDSSLSHALSGRAMVEAKFDGKKFENGGVLKPSLRAGIDGNTMLGSDKTDVTVLGSNLSFDPQGGDNTIDGIIGVNLSLARSERFNLYVDAEASLGLNNGGASDNKGAIGRLGAKWKF
jgi:hypothetical protein